MGQSVSRRLSPPRLEFDHRPVHVGLMVGKRVLRQVFLPELLLPPVRIIPPLLHSYLHVSLRQKDKRSKLGNLPKSIARKEIWEHCTEG
jgi:hypothetical protein